MNKQEKIVHMFDEIASTYDKANTAMSLGVHDSWRKKACDIVYKKLQAKDINIIDIACGTGDMMSSWSARASKFGKNILNLVGVDPSKGMLGVAKNKFPSWHFINANAANTTLESEFGDILSISYGIRNVVERDLALKEFNRVLKLGGYLVVLEFTKSQKGGLIHSLRDFYIKHMVPIIGTFISKNKSAYEYLPNSISNFLDKDAFANELKENGFEVELIKGFSFDVSTLFVAKKIRNLSK
ncbi:MAG: bifunctional demethylmenaquinone methyltransferase/2-methoxy-6-polyprenyl-1,4-benzoquinol methylase UbiE [Campylobacter sp.]|nr:bifunctional demethylmenaquinone methyltransferase/2-methoxy-6-polyprenyl-1,4-benzoquinol methylase UbiE [Campylobacter sp.]